MTTETAQDTFTVSIPVTVTRGFLWDVLTTAVESHYEWFRFRNAKRLPADHPTHAHCITAVQAQEIDCDEPRAPVLERFEIDLQKVLDAAQKIATGGLTHKGHARTVAQALSEDDAGMIDSDLADCILQVACFNELRYG